MGAGDVGWLHGVAADTNADGPNLRGMSSFKPDAISDADFAAVVRRGLDELRRLDEVHMPGPADAVPQSRAGTARSVEGSSRQAIYKRNGNSGRKTGQQTGAV